MMKKILMLLCIAMLAFTFAFPIFVYPFGEYSGTSTVAGKEINYSASFHFDGTVDYKLGNTTQHMYYKVKDKKIYTSINKDFEIKDSSKPFMELNSLYSINVVDTDITIKSTVGICLTIGYGILLLLCVAGIISDNRFRRK